MSKHMYSYLALGDSYTIGEGVPIFENFPYQMVQMLRKKGIPIYAPEIIAKTGWTTFELAQHVLHAQFNHAYDFVTLLIGVNNQYRNLTTEEYKSDFEFLLKKAIHFSGENPRHVMVLSIPDWGVTPFAKGKDQEKISEAIDEFNRINKHLSDEAGVHYINITPSSREAKSDTSLLAPDNLHYSQKEYQKWAMQVVENIITNI
jgi:lysophospholipase L1-like esterase